MNGCTERIQPARELHYKGEGALDLAWQEKNGKGRRWYVSLEHVQVQLHQDGESSGNLLCLNGSHAETSRTVIKKNTMVLVFAFRLCHNIMSSRSHEKTVKMNGCEALPHQHEQ